MPATSGTLRALARSLRFRLTLSYVLLFTLVTIGFGWGFRGLLNAIFLQQVEQILEEEWGEVKGFLRVENRVPVWFYDKEDPDEAAIVGRLRSGPYLLTDGAGRVLEVSDIYRNLGVESPEEIRRMIDSNRRVVRVRAGPHGFSYLVREGVFTSDGVRYFVAIGRALDERDRIIAEFSRTYLILAPLGIAGICIAGWLVARRALRPVVEVAQAAQSLTGENLSLRIPERGSGDELDHLIRTFNSMVARLEQSFTQMRQFSTDVSHELRTPLTVIRGHLEVAMMTAHTTEQYQEAILTALNDVERLTTTVKALLELSRAESGQLALKKKPLHLGPLLTELTEHLRIVAEDKQLHLHLAIVGDPVVFADKVQIERLITNLVSNAIKYTPERGHVTVRLSASAPDAVLVIEDTGRGIPPESLPHIFDRFYRVPGPDQPNEERGLGLGLSFVAWIVKAHEGRIEVESEKGQGTRFRIRLPLVTMPLPAAPEPTATPR
ncbi:MAG: HAMP domain-containing protein [Bryobacteraceae bacterium]|nr:HAMP domain-containing protein [Bryobacteraceae bacterium]